MGNSFMREEKKEQSLVSFIYSLNRDLLCVKFINGNCKNPCPKFCNVP